MKLGQAAQPAAVALVTACADEDEAAREAATAALEELGPPATVDAPRLAALLPDEQADIAYWAATLLGRLRATASEQVPQLVAALESHPAVQVRQRAAWALGQIGPAAGEATDALRVAAGSDDPRLARLAEQALAQIADQ